MQPSDILANDQDYTIINNVKVRKGSIAAFMANCKIIDSAAIDSDEYQIALQDLLVLYPQLAAIVVFECFEIKSENIKQVLRKALNNDSSNPQRLKSPT